MIRFLLQMEPASSPISFRELLMMVQVSSM